VVNTHYLARSFNAIQLTGFYFLFSASGLAPASAVRASSAQYTVVVRKPSVLCMGWDYRSPHAFVDNLRQLLFWPPSFVFFPWKEEEGLSCLRNHS
jgi:hypothetical protein